MMIAEQMKRRTKRVARKVRLHELTPQREFAMVRARARATARMGARARTDDGCKRSEDGMRHIRRTAHGAVGRVHAKTRAAKKHQEHGEGGDGRGKKDGRRVSRVEGVHQLWNAKTAAKRQTTYR